jgi:hypothetical protein
MLKYSKNKTDLKQIPVLREVAVLVKEKGHKPDNQIHSTVCQMVRSAQEDKKVGRR